MRYGSADGRYGNAGHLVEVGHAAGPSIDVATEDLIHDTQLIERTFASVLLSQLPEQIPTEFDNDLSRYVVWSIRHPLVSVPRISR